MLRLLALPWPPLLRSVLLGTHAAPAAAAATTAAAELQCLLANLISRRFIKGWVSARALARAHALLLAHTRSCPRARAAGAATACARSAMLPPRAPACHHPAARAPA